jgi:hypothetical protein
MMMQVLIQPMATILLGGAQESRRAMNQYAKPVGEREFTSCPFISHHFLSLELYYSNYIRRTQFVQGDDYVPKWFTDQVELNLFPRQEATNEAGEQWQQLMKIFHTLKYRALMFKTVAKEKDGATYAEKVEEMTTSAKGQQSTKTGAPSPRAAEVFGRKEFEAKRLAHRRITARNIMMFFTEWAKSVRVDLTDVLLERFELTGD